MREKKKNGGFLLNIWYSCVSVPGRKYESFETKNLTKQKKQKNYAKWKSSLWTERNIENDLKDIVVRGPGWTEHNIFTLNMIYAHANCIR